MLNELNASITLFITLTKENASILAIILGLPWAVFILNILLGNRLLLLGIFPRHILGLLGILFCPLLHAHFNHLFFNSIPLLVLSDFLLTQGVDYFIQVTVFITLVSGFLIWCFAKPGLHIGASSLITGYWGLLVINIYRQGSLTAILLGLISIYYFAGIFLGIFPSTQKNISWEGHLFGLLAGIAAAYAII